MKERIFGFKAKYYCCMGSISKGEIKFIRSLHRKKERKATLQFLIEGEKLFSEALAIGAEFSRVFMLKGCNLISAFPDAIIVTESEMESVTALSNASPVLAVLHQKPNGWRKFDDSATRVLALDGISDPGNLGTIIRSADWFGVQHLMLSSSCVDIFNPKVVQATMGSIFHVSWEQADLVGLLKKRKAQGFKVVSSHLEGNGMSALRVAEKMILVIGSESHGVSDAVLDLTDERLKIQGHGSAESLNAAIAASICLYEWTRDD